MTTQYTPTLKLALPVTGELSGTWGDVVNDNITSMVEQAIAGLATINSWTANSHTLSTADGTTSESRCAMLVLTDTGVALSGAATVICPTASKIYIVKNTSGQSATIKTAAGTGVAIPNGETMFVFCDGTNVVQAVTRIASADVDFAKLKGTGAVVVTNILDEDNMASNSATALATQQSIKAYVDSQISANNDLSEILANGNTTGGTDIVVSAGDVITTDTINETTAAAGVTIDGVLIKDNGLTASGAVTVSVNSSTNALRITQTGAGNALLVEDSTNPDSTPFVIDASGNVLIGSASQVQSRKLTVNSSAVFVGENSAPLLYTSRSGGTIASPSIVSNGNNLGEYRWHGHDGTDYIQAASLLAAVDGTPGTNDMPGRLVFSTTADGASSPTERLRIDSSGTVLMGTTTNTNSSKLVVDGTISETVSSTQYLVASQADIGTAPNKIPLNGYLGSMAYQDSTSVTVGDLNATGNVGIGTSSPSDSLDVASAAPTLRLTDTDGYYAQIYAGSGSLVFRTDVGQATAGDSMQFVLSGSERMRIDSAGNVGIGTSSPSGTLDVSTGQDADASLTANIILGGTAANSRQASISKLANGLGVLTIQSSNSASTGAAIVFNTNASSEAMRITSAGNVGIGTSSPAQALHVKTSTSATPITLGVLSNATGLPALSFNGSYASTTMAGIYGNGATGSNLYYEVPAGHNHYFGIADSTKMTLDSSGNLLVGTTSAVGKLVIGATGGTNFISMVDNANGGVYGRLVYDNNYFSYKPNSGVAAFTVDPSGNLLVGTTSTIGANSNTKQVVGGNFRTFYNAATIPASSTATILTLSSSATGVYIVNANFGPQGNNIYGGVLIVVANLGSFRIVTNGGGSSSALSLSGANVQITNVIGAPLDATASAIFIGNN